MGRLCSSCPPPEPRSGVRRASAGPAATRSGGASAGPPPDDTGCRRMTHPQSGSRGPGLSSPGTPPPAAVQAAQEQRAPHAGHSGMDLPLTTARTGGAVADGVAGAGRARSALVAVRIASAAMDTRDGRGGPAAARGDTTDTLLMMAGVTSVGASKNWTRTGTQPQRHVCGPCAHTGRHARGGGRDPQGTGAFNGRQPHPAGRRAWPTPPAPPRPHHPLNTQSGVARVAPSAPRPPPRPGTRRPLACGPAGNGFTVSLS